MRTYIIIGMLLIFFAFSEGIFALESSCKVEGPYAWPQFRLDTSGYLIERGSNNETYLYKDGQKYGPYENSPSDFIFFSENNYIYKYADQEQIAKANELMKGLKPGETARFDGSDMIVYNGKKYGPYLNAQIVGSLEGKILGFRYSQNDQFYLNVAGKVQGPYKFIGNSYGIDPVKFHPNGKSYTSSYTKLSDGKVYLNKDGKEIGPYEAIYNYSYSPSGNGFSYSYKKDGKYGIMKDGKVIGTFATKILEIVYADEDHLDYVIDQNKSVVIVHLGKEYGPFPYSYLNNNLNLILSGDGKHFFYSYVGNGNEPKYVIDGVSGTFLENQTVDIGKDTISVITLSEEKKITSFAGTRTLLTYYERDGASYVSAFGKEYPFYKNDKVSGTKDLNGNYILSYTLGNSLYIDRCTLSDFNKKSPTSSKTTSTVTAIPLTTKEKELIKSMLLKFKNIEKVKRGTYIASLEKKLAATKKNTRGYAVLKELITKIKELD